jgi:hypothetical protein
MHLVVLIATLGRTVIIFVLAKYAGGMRKCCEGKTLISEVIERFSSFGLFQ